MVLRPYGRKRIRSRGAWRWIQAALVAAVFLPLWFSRWEAKPIDSSEWREGILQSYQDQHPGADNARLTGDAIKAWFPRRTDGIHEPLWPWLAAWALPDGEGGNWEADVMIAQKRWIGLAVAALAVGGVLGRMFSGAGAALWLATAGLGVFLGDSEKFGSAALFDLLYCLAWILLAGLFRRNRFWLYTASGITLGLAFMCGHGAGELFAAFLLVGTWKFLGEVMPLFWRKQPDEIVGRWNWQRHLIGVSLFLSGFFLTAGPRLGESYERHGEMFFRTVNYWRWLDTPEESRAFEKEWNAPREEDRSEEEGMAAPSWETWVGSHSLADGVDRLRAGVRVYGGRLLGGAYAPLIFGLAVVTLILLCVLRWGCQPPATVRQAWPREAEGVALFMMAALFFRFLVFSWDLASSPRPLSIQEVYPPLILCLIWALESVRKRIRQRQGPVWLGAVAAVALLGAAAWFATQS